ncbi:acetyl-CoA-benzylalcohol acetyltransferase-like [Tripterygium wilfordii]|uniref:acetyl-CoA-benzylalcohol acetyltransferase-like n=1 Tax=Tripterygium wilfordii TaxID=458696 RepID=UPI0018F7ED56|nr:acetyl-CoA-benzylalcohol acetyltransferase-like [Tripterygium wilfordii]
MGVAWLVINRRLRERGKISNIISVMIISGKVTVTAMYTMTEWIRRREIQEGSKIFINSFHQTSSNTNSRLKMEVQIISQKLIKPSTPTPSHLRNMELSFIDRIAPQAYSHVIFYYPVQRSLTIHDGNERCNKLEKSLSEILTHHYPLAGRYLAENHMVECNDEGAEYVELKVRGELSQLLMEEPSDAELSTCFIPYGDEISTDILIPLKVRVHKFDCGGLVIAICISHSIADGGGILSFMNGWATACREGLRQVNFPNFNLGSLFPARATEFSTPVPEFNRLKLITKRFVFSGDSISKLKAKAMPKSGDVKRQPSKVKVVKSLIWKVLIGMSQMQHGKNRNSLMIFPVNLRGKTVLIPENSCGNAYKLAVARFTPEENEPDLDVLVSLLDDLLLKDAAQNAALENGDELFSTVTNHMKEVNEEVSKGEADIFLFSSWCRFPFYEVDFGWGKPSWVTGVNRPMELNILMDDKYGEGIEAWVTLEENHMVQFQQDQDIVAFSTNPSNQHQSFGQDSF